MIGATADTDRRRQAIFAKAGQLAGAGPAGTEHRDKGLRLSRRAGSRIYLLEIAINRPWRGEGTRRLRNFYASSHLIFNSHAGGRTLTSAAHCATTDHGFAPAPRGAPWGDIQSR